PMWFVVRFSNRLSRPVEERTFSDALSSRCGRRTATQIATRSRIPLDSVFQSNVERRTHAGAPFLFGRGLPEVDRSVDLPRMPSSMVATLALSAHGVSKRFGDIQALDGVSLDVPTGACVALVGESGSGKSTLLRCFNRLVDPDAGVVCADGVD